MTSADPRKPPKADARMLKPVLRYQPGAKILRLFRLRWGRNPSCSGFTNRLSVSVLPSLFGFSRDGAQAKGYAEWRCTILGLRVHYQHDHRGVLL